MFAFGHVQSSPRPSQLWDIFNNLPILLLELSLCLLVPKRDAETRVLGEGEKKNSFITLPGKGGSQQASASKALPPLGEIGRWFYSLGSEK